MATGIKYMAGQLSREVLFTMDVAMQCPAVLQLLIDSISQKLVRKCKEKANYSMQLYSYLTVVSTRILSSDSVHDVLPNPWYGCSNNSNMHHHIPDGRKHPSSN